MGGLPSIPSSHGGDVAATTAFAVIEKSVHSAQMFDSCSACSLYSNHTDVLIRNQTCTYKGENYDANETGSKKDNLE